MLSECQTAWIWVRRRVNRRLIQIQAVCIWNYSCDWWDKGQHEARLIYWKEIVSLKNKCADRNLVKGNWFLYWTRLVPCLTKHFSSSVKYDYSTSVNRFNPIALCRQSFRIILECFRLDSPRVALRRYSYRIYPPYIQQPIRSQLWTRLFTQKRGPLDTSWSEKNTSDHEGF